MLILIAVILGLILMAVLFPKLTRALVVFAVAVVVVVLVAGQH